MEILRMDQSDDDEDFKQPLQKELSVDSVAELSSNKISEQSQEHKFSNSLSKHSSNESITLLGESRVGPQISDSILEFNKFFKTKNDLPEETSINNSPKKLQPKNKPFASKKCACITAIIICVVLVLCSIGFAIYFFVDFGDSETSTVQTITKPIKVPNPQKSKTTPPVSKSSEPTTVDFSTPDVSTPDDSTSTILISTTTVHKPQNQTVKATTVQATTLDDSTQSIIISNTTIQTFQNQTVKSTTNPNNHPNILTHRFKIKSPNNDTLCAMPDYSYKWGPYLAFKTCNKTRPDQLFSFTEDGQIKNSETQPYYKDLCYSGNSRYPSFCHEELCVGHYGNCDKQRYYVNLFKCIENGNHTQHQRDEMFEVLQDSDGFYTFKLKNICPGYTNDCLVVHGTVMHRGKNAAKKIYNF